MNIQTPSTAVHARLKRLSRPSTSLSFLIGRLSLHATDLLISSLPGSPNQQEFLKTGPLEPGGGMYNYAELAQEAQRTQAQIDLLISGIATLESPYPHLLDSYSPQPKETSKALVRTVRRSADGTSKSRYQSLVDHCKALRPAWSPRLLSI